MAAVLQAKTRDKAKKSYNKQLRQQGNIPAVLYGNDAESKSVYVSNSDFTKTIREVGRNGVISLKIDGDNNDYPVMVYDLQVDSIKDEPIHADFYKVDMSSEVDAEVYVNLVGESLGQKDGGVLQESLREINVRALPADIPELIEINVEELNIGDSISVSDLTGSGKYEILNDPEEVIVSVSPPAQEETEPSDDEETQEPEVIGEKSDEDDGEDNKE